MKSQINEVLQQFADYVQTHEYQASPMLTVYADIDSTKPENQRENPAWLIELKNEVKEHEAQYAAQLKRRKTQQQWTDTEQMVLSYLRDRRPTGRSVAFFSDLNDYLAVDLPVNLPTRVYFGFPQIKHLLFALDQHKKYLVVLLSGAEVRLVNVFLTRTTDDVTYETDHDKQRRVSRKSMEAGQDRRSPEYERRFVNEIASELNHALMDDPDSERIVLGGNLKLAHAVNNALHPAVRERVVAVESIDFKASDQEIAAAVKELAAAYEEAHDLAEVEELIRLANQGGAAVLERQGVETALARGQVKKLILPYPIDAAEFDELIVDAILHNTEIEFVYGPAAERLNEFGGIGARLYYSLA